MDELFKLIRESCSSHVWSRGVEIARANGVVGESISDEEAVLRVASPGRAVSATVKLRPDDEDFFCDCGSPASPCEHVAAAIIAVRRARERGEALPVSKVARGIVTYHFSRVPGRGLALERRIRAGEAETRIDSSLSALLSGRAAGPAVNATKEDLAIDGMVRDARGPALAAAALTGVLLHLRNSSHVTLDGAPVAVGDPVPPARLVVSDADEGAVRVVPAKLPLVEGGGATLDASGLRPIREPDLSAAEKEIVQRGRVFARTELAELASRLLPALEAKLPVEILTERLPKQGGKAERPRLLFQTEARGDMLSVLPLIVYGDPPYARVDGGKLTLLPGHATLPERNEYAESRLASVLQTELGFSVGKRLDFRGEAASRIVERLATVREASLAGNGVAHFGTRPALLPRLDVDGDRVALSFQAPGGGSASIARVFQAWREGQARVALDGGEGWAPLPADWLARYGNRVLDLLDSRDAAGAVPAHARPEVAALCAELETPCPPELTRLRAQLETYAGIPSHPLPADLTAALRPYQKRGVDWLAFLRSSGLGALLADDMGLGKTLQTIAVLAGRSLVVAPTSVLPNWVKELARFRPGLRVSVYHGPDRKLDDRADVTLTTYAILRLDADALAARRWDIAVLDEAQNVKNPASQVAQAAFRLDAAFRVALTGTPVENRLEDLWSLFHFLNRGLLGGRATFAERYGGADVAALRARTKPFILRRLKQEVAPELPPRTDVVLYCELEPDERATYDAVRTAARKEVLETLGKNGGVLAALECLLRLRQAACHPALLPGAAVASSSKVRLLREKLEEVVAEGHKALVFSQWTSLLDLIEPEARAAGLAFCRIDGATRDRMAVVESFQSASGPPVLLMTLKAGGVGLNLTAADYVFLVDPWWNPAAEDQAADRAHRIGQDRPVFVHRLVARDTVEEKILALQDAKRATAEAALAGGAAAGGITREELMGLLG